MGEEDRKICHRMSRAVPTDDLEDSFGALVSVWCVEDECAIWDPMLGCCGEFSPVLEPRTQLRMVVSGVIEEMSGSLERKVDLRDRLVENLKELGMSSVEGQRDKMLVRYAEVGGQADMLNEVIRQLRARFGV